MQITKEPRRGGVSFWLKVDGKLNGTQVTLIDRIYTDLQSNKN
jgi:hypothetical protein